MKGAAKMKEESTGAKIIKWVFVLVFIALGVVTLIDKVNAGSLLFFLAAILLMPTKANRDIWKQVNNPVLKTFILLFLVVYGFVGVANAHALKIKDEKLEKCEALIQEYKEQLEGKQQEHTEYAVSETDEVFSPADASPSGETCTYVVNIKTGKFHYDWCESVGQIKDKNKEEITATREEMLAQGYKPCGECCP